MPENKQKYSSWELVWRALSFTRPHRGFVAVILLLTLVVTTAGVVEPLIMKYIFDQLSEESTFQLILYGVAGLFILAVVKETAGGFSNWLTWRTRILIQYHLMERTVEHIHRLPFDYHRKHGIGAIMTKLERSVQNFIRAVSELTFNLIPALVYLIMALVVMIELNWKMSLLVLAFTPIPALIAAKAAPVQTQRERFLLEKWGQIYSRFNEVLSGIVTVRSFAMEDYEKGRFLGDVEKANRVVVKGVKYDSGVGALQNFATFLARIAAIAFGGYLFFQDELTLGTLIAFLGYIGGLFGPVQGLTGIYSVSKTAGASLEHIFSILDTQEYLGDEPGATELKDVKGKVDFNHVRFSFRNGDNLVLKDIDLHVEARESLAIVGPSGSGKTTMMALLQRFYDPGKGEVLIDDQNIRQIKQQSLRRHIGVVLQDALLFNESVRDNIAYGRPDASDEEIRMAAEMAHAHHFISELEGGYSTRLGERGTRLSMGQRQRIAIARAILKDPSILILDEATSALDAESEGYIQEALNNLMGTRTSFIIAHRLSTVVNANRIIVLKEGRIIEDGTHKDLMDKDGYYASLVKRQTKGLIPER